VRRKLDPKVVKDILKDLDEDIPLEIVEEKEKSEGL